jgi:hypothetical protein
MDFEAALREACIEADNNYWKSFFEHIDSMPEILIPEEKDKRLRDFIHNYEIASAGKKNRKGMKRGIKALLIAAIVLLAIAVTAFAFEPFRNIIYKVYTDCTEFVFESVKGNKDDYLYAEYSYIPEGYILVQNNKTKTSQKIIYENERYQIVIQTDTGSNSVLGIDTENAEFGDININGFDGYYSINQTSIIVAWSTGRNHHVICADQNNRTNLDDVIQIAQSAKPTR